MAQNVNYILNSQGAWSNTTQYTVSQIIGIGGILAYLCPLVTHNGDMYLANDVNDQPILGTAPNADSAWTIFEASSETNLAPATVATTANVTLSGEQTIDGVLTSASRVLVRAQTLSQNNGIYTTSAGAWLRTSDANSWDEFVGSSIQVLQGTVQTGYIYSCTVEPGGTLGTTPITYSQTGIVQPILGTAPITVTGNTISLSNKFITISASTAPTTTDDLANGYIAGSLWFVTSTNIGYRCTDSSNGAAVWVRSTYGVNNVTTTNPGTANDVSQGYAVGSIWRNNTLGINYICTSAAAGAATWALTTIKNNVTASGAPAVSNDNTQGYSIGSTWFAVDTQFLYVASDVTTGAAVWSKVLM